MSLAVPSIRSWRGGVPSPSGSIRLTVFLDASALTATIGDEPESGAFEAARAISRGAEPEQVLAQVLRYREQSGIVVVPIGEPEASEATRAHAHYGKGTGHPAESDMGDRFACSRACAKVNRAKLLYKGGDFIHTDMR